MGGRPVSDVPSLGRQSEAQLFKIQAAHHQVALAAADPFFTEIEAVGATNAYPVRATGQTETTQRDHAVEELQIALLAGRLADPCRDLPRPQTV